MPFEEFFTQKLVKNVDAWVNISVTVRKEYSGERDYA